MPAISPVICRAGPACGGTGWQGSGPFSCWTTPLAAIRLPRCFPGTRIAWSWSLAAVAAETRASMLTLAAEKDSVAAAFEVSYRHLDPGQREFFQRLGLH